MFISIIRSVILYILILFAVRLMGKRQISEMQTSELVITLLMSNIATIPMQDTAQPMLSGIIPMMVLLVCEIFLSYLMLRRSHIRSIICGKPIIVIRKGQPDQQAMIRLRMSTEDLLEQLRQKDVFDIRDVAYGIIETNGKLSILKNADCESVSAKDMHLKKPPAHLMAAVVSDGEMAPHSMQLCRLNQQDVLDIIQKEGCTLQDVFLMTANDCGDYCLIRKEEANE